MSPRQSGKLITALRREGADPVRKGRPWSLPVEDRVLLVAAYWRTNLTLRHLAPLFGVSKSAADRIIDDVAPSLALQQRKRFRKNTVLIVDGTLIPTNRSHRKVRTRVEHACARMKSWKILRDCRLKGDGVHHATLGVARLHNLTLAA
nr:transposase family protein [Streptomyces thermoviolaceus]